MGIKSSSFNRTHSRAQRRQSDLKSGVVNPGEQIFPDKFVLVIYTKVSFNQSNLRTMTFLLPIYTYIVHKLFLILGKVNTSKVFSSTIIFHDHHDPLRPHNPLYQNLGVVTPQPPGF